MCVLLCVFTAACVLGEGVEMSSWLDGHSFILSRYLQFKIGVEKQPRVSAQSTRRSLHPARDEYRAECGRTVRCICWERMGWMMVCLCISSS